MSERKPTAVTPSETQPTGRRWHSGPALVIAPLLVGLIAFLAVSLLQSREQAHRTARVHVAAVQESATVSEALLDHAAMMGGVTPDLPPRLEAANTQATGALSELQALLPDSGEVDGLAQRWQAFALARDRVLEGLGPVGGADHAHDGYGEYGAPQAWPGAGGGEGDDPLGDLHDASSRLHESTRAVDERLQQLAKGANRVTNLGVIAALVLVALVVVLLLRVRERGRRTAELAHAEQEVLRRSESRFQALVQNATDVVTVTDSEGRIVYETDPVTTVLGHDAAARVGRLAFADVHPDDLAKAEAAFNAAVEGAAGAQRLEVKVQHADGSWRWIDMHITNLLHDSSVRGVVINHRDVTDRQDLAAQLRRQAFTDPITSLPNRALFQDRLEHTLRAAKRSGAACAVLFCDLDDFKAINERFGHEVGDLLLARVASRLQACLRPADTIARLGGDEFAFLLQGVSDAADAERVATRIIESLETPIELEGEEVVMKASLGVAIAVGGKPGSDELLRNADFAMYMAKSDEGSSYALFDTAAHRQKRELAEFETALRNAPRNGELVLHYQPILDLTTRRVIAAEALVRWMHPTEGMVPPLKFIPLAEKTGLIVEIGEWVLAEACRQLAQWRAEIPEYADLAVSVNVSARQLQEGDLPGLVRRVLRTCDLPPEALILEITETTAADDPVFAQRQLGELQQMGIKVALDDFGVGYSSLSYLRTLPVSVLKVDRSFINELEAGAEDAALAHAIIKVGRTLTMEVVAEGIETLEQCAQLLSMGCPLGQGYLFGKPVEASEFADVSKTMPDMAEALTNAMQSGGNGKAAIASRSQGSDPTG